MEKTVLMLSMIAVLCVGGYAFEGQKTDRRIVNDGMTQVLLVYGDVGQCMGDCASDQGICMGDCQGDGNCIARCADAYGRCVSRCN